jgi:3-oxoacyl-[acyl-carrier protein] reductase
LTAPLLGSGSPAAVGIAADNADPAAADRLITAALTRFGRLDGVLLSIGEPPTGPLTAVSDQ